MDYDEAYQRRKRCWQIYGRAFLTIGVLGLITVVLLNLSNTSSQNDESHLAKIVIGNELDRVELSSQELENDKENLIYSESQQAVKIEKHSQTMNYGQLNDLMDLSVELSGDAADYELDEKLTNLEKLPKKNRRAVTSVEGSTSARAKPKIDVHISEEYLSLSNNSIYDSNYDDSFNHTAVRRKGEHSPLHEHSDGGQYIFVKRYKCVPYRGKNRPAPEKLQYWKRNGMFAFNVLQ